MKHNNNLDWDYSFNILNDADFSLLKTDYNKSKLSFFKKFNLSRKTCLLNVSLSVFNFLNHLLNQKVHMASLMLSEDFFKL